MTHIQSNIIIYNLNYFTHVQLINYYYKLKHKTIERSNS